jgi:hypothetical protein
MSGVETDIPFSTSKSSNAEVEAAIKQLKQIGRAGRTLCACGLGDADCGDYWQPPNHG